MKTLEMNIAEVLSLHGALQGLMRIAGVPFKKSYLIKRNIDKLVPIVQDWYEVKAKPIFEKYAIEMPGSKLIQPQEHEKFKADVFASLDELLNPDLKVGDLVDIHKEIKSIFEKYEVEADTRHGIPMEKARQYKKEVTDLSKETMVTLEFFDIELDRNLENVLSQLELEFQISISNIISEESQIQIAKTILQ